MPDDDSVRQFLASFFLDRCVPLGASIALALALSETVHAAADERSAVKAPTVSAPPSNSARLRQGWQLMEQARVARRFDECERHYREIEPVALGEFSEFVAVVLHQRVFCQVEATPAYQRTAPNAIHLYQPVLDHLDRLAETREDARALRGRAQLDLGHMLRYMGFHAESDALMREWVTSQLQLAVQPALRARALATLEGFARAYYGAYGETVLMAEHHHRFATVLGEGERPTLLLLQARIFNLRRAGRQQEALQLCDEFDRAIQKHRPGDERLSMALRSERSAALASIGRMADAIDDLQAILDWQKNRRPESPIGVMRAAYNLASLHLALADADAAERLALESIAAGEQAPDSLDSQETAYPRVLVAYARFLRDGDAAADALLAALNRLPKDPAVHDAFFDLARRLQRPRDDPMKRAAQEAYVAHLTQTFTPERAERSMVAEVELHNLRLGEVEAIGLGASGVAWAHAQDRPDLEARLYFAWARHLAAVNPDGAVWVYKLGSLALLRLRQNALEAAPDKQAAWMTRWDESLRDFIGLLIDQGRLVEAEQAIEVLREEEVTAFQRRSRGPRVRRAAASSSISLTPREASGQARLQPLIETLRSAASDFQRRLMSQADYEGRFRATDDAMAAAITQLAAALREEAALPTRRQATSVGLVKVHALPPGHAKLSAFQREQRLELVLQVGQRLHRASVPLPSAEVSREVHRLRVALLRPDNTIPGSLLVLHNWLIRPFARHLSGLRELRVAMDGSLRYVPFAALHDGQRFLGDRLAVVTEIAGARSSGGRQLS